MRLFTMFAMLFAMFIAADSAHAMDYRQNQWSYKMRFRIVFLGDGLTAGEGLAVEESWPVRLTEKLRRDLLRFDVTYINLAAPGDTASRALSKLPQVVAEKPTIAIVQLGAEDARQRIDPNVTRNALDQILNTLRFNKIYTLLVAMPAPPDAPAAYAARMDSMYPKLARDYGAVLCPNVLAGVQGDRLLMQYNMIHPNADGAVKVANTIAEYLWHMSVKVARSRYDQPEMFNRN